METEKQNNRFALLDVSLKYAADKFYFKNMLSMLI